MHQGDKRAGSMKRLRLNDNVRLQMDRTDLIFYFFCTVFKKLFGQQPGKSPCNIVWLKNCFGKIWIQILMHCLVRKKLWFKKGQIIAILLAQTMDGIWLGTVQHIINSERKVLTHQLHRGNVVRKTSWMEITYTLADDAPWKLDSSLIVYV